MKKKIKKDDDNLSLPKYEFNESKDDYDSDESPEDYDPANWDPETEVVFEFDYSSKSKKVMEEIQGLLFNNSFEISSPYKFNGEWHESVSKQIKLKEYEATEKLVNEIFMDKKSSCGYFDVRKTTGY